MSEYIVRETGYPGTIKQEVVQELVRCKDCKYQNEDKFCDRWAADPYEAGWAEDDDYCSYAERRENEPTAED